MEGLSHSVLETVTFNAILMVLFNLRDPWIDMFIVVKNLSAAL